MVQHGPSHSLTHSLSSTNSFHYSLQLFSLSSKCPSKIHPFLQIFVHHGHVSESLFRINISCCRLHFHTIPFHKGAREFTFVSGKVERKVVLLDDNTYERGYGNNKNWWEFSMLECRFFFIESSYLVLKVSLESYKCVQFIF
jgi:hypothetical protein